VVNIFELTLLNNCTSKDSARRIAKVSAEAKLPVEEEDYVQSFRPHLMDVVNLWTQGAPFSQICQMTEVFEGSIIRCIRRLEELMRQMCQAAKAIGNTELEQKFADGKICSYSYHGDLHFRVTINLSKIP